MPHRISRPENTSGREKLYRPANAEDDPGLDEDESWNSHEPAPGLTPEIRMAGETK
jgi:hypothetical protein